MAIHPILGKQNDMARPDSVNGHPVISKAELKMKKNPYTSAHQIIHANDYHRDVHTWMPSILISRNTIIPM
jgi:hypothetical protein